MFMGYPVEFSQLMPSVEANNQIPVWLGDLSLAVTFGDRMQETISFSEHASVGGQSMWERNQIGIRGTQRFDAVCHSFGTDTTPGPSTAPWPLAPPLINATLPCNRMVTS